MTKLRVPDFCARPVRTFGFLLLFWGATGCSFRDTEAPHMIHVPAIDVETSVAEGSASSRIEEVWVYTETDVHGAFPLPADIPWPVEDGPATLRFLPGIRANAVAATRVPYPFYSALEWDVLPVAGGRDTVAWTTGYNEFAEVMIVEDFELANRFTETTTSTAEMVRVTSGEWVYEGDASGLVTLTPTEALITASTNEQQLSLNPDGPVWLEFDFRCNQQFAIGLEAHNLLGFERTPILVLNPTEGVWKKVYLDLGPVVRSATTAAWFELALDANYDGTVDTAFIGLDNLKIIQYE